MRITATNRIFQRRGYYYYKITLMRKYTINDRACVSRELTHFVGIELLITKVNWILLTQVQETKPIIVSEYNLVSGFGTTLMWIYGSWDDCLIFVSKY